MSAIAIFRLSCCNREIAHGRYCGSDMYPPKKKKCPFGCVNKKNPRGKPEPHALLFDRYEFDDTISPELAKTDKYLRPSDLWHKYNREWLRRKEAAGQGAPTGKKAVVQR